jgi:hypothetical protein
MLTVDTIGNRFVLASQVDISMSGKLLDLKDGRIEATK